jgi:hypothetical protein
LIMPTSFVVCMVRQRIECRFGSFREGMSFPKTSGNMRIGG